MNTKITFSSSNILMILFLSTLIFACQNDDESDSNPIDFYVEGALMTCPSEVFNLSNVSFQINQAYEYENLIIGGGFSDMVIFNPATGDLIEIETIGVNHFLEYDNKLMICAEEGLFSFDSQQNISIEAGEPCISILLSTSGTLLMTSSDKRILSWDSSQGLMPYTDGHQTNFIDMSNLIELSNGELWATTGDGKIARFKDQLFLGFYDTDDIPLNDFVIHAPMFMATYEEGVILVAKNGLSYQIFKYTNNQE